MTVMIRWAIWRTHRWSGIAEFCLGSCCFSSINASCFSWYSHGLSKVWTPTFFLWKFTSSFIEAHLFNVFSRLKQKKNVMIITTNEPKSCFQFDNPPLFPSVKLKVQKQPVPRQIAPMEKICYKIVPTCAPAS